MSLERKRYLISRDVVGDETCLPFVKAMQLCQQMPTRYEQGDEGELDAEAFQDGVQPDPSDGLALFDTPDAEDIPEEVDVLNLLWVAVKLIIKIKNLLMYTH